ARSTHRRHDPPERQPYGELGRPGETLAWIGAAMVSVAAGRFFAIARLGRQRGRQVPRPGTEVPAAEFGLVAGVRAKTWSGSAVRSITIEGRRRIGGNRPGCVSV